MMWAQVVLGLLVGESPEDRRQRRRVRVFVVVLGLVGLVGLGGTGWVVAQAGIHGWQTGDWERLFSAILLPWGFLIVLFAVLVISITLNLAPSGFTQPLRELVASGDMRISYPGAIQPLPLVPEERAVGAQSFQRLRVTEGWPNRYRFLGVVPGLIVPAMMTLENLPQAMGAGYVEWSLWLFPVAMLGLVGVAVISTIVLIRTIVGPRARMSITVDEQGLTWRRGKRRPKQQMGWHAVRSFSVMVYEDNSGFSVKRTTYLVDGGDTLLTWTLYFGSGPDEYGEAWQLSRQIVTHSGQLLRDLTPLTMSLRVTSAKPGRLRTIGAPEPLIATMTAAKRRFYRIWFVGVPLMVGLFAMLFVSLLGNHFAQDYQQHYFAGLVPRIHAGKQLYHNTLTVEDSEWLTLPPSVADDEMTLGVVDGAYQMSAPTGQTAEWTIEPSFGDMAVEAMLQLSGQTTKYSGAGLILHSLHSGDNMVVFFIDPFNGWWSLEHYMYYPGDPDHSWHPLDDGVSSAIHRGAGAKNTLLALVRGDVILLYINEHFIRSYSAQDRYNDNNYGNPLLIHNGLVGVYDNDGANVARFNDFTVYAIKSPPSLEYA